jgi:hypothetical protein
MYRGNWNAGRKLIVILLAQQRLKGNSGMGNRDILKEVGAGVRLISTFRPKHYDRRRVYVAAHVYEARSKLLLCKLCRKKTQNFDRSSKKWETFNVTETYC